MRLIKKKLLKILLICTFIIIIVPLAILSCWSVEYFRKAEKWSLNNISTEHAKALTELNLTNKQKLKDFEYFYNLIAESVPMLNDYKTLYGIDFLSKKDYYHNLILKTKNDFEFYCVMYAICGDIPSCHTGFLFPDYYKNRYCYGYNYANVMDTKGFESATYYWYGTIKNTLKDYLYDGVLFNYVDGKYIYNENLSDISCSGKTLVSIDGISADEYIKNIISIHSLKYDFIKDKVYREYLFFNNTDGTPVDIILEDDYGNKEILNLYINFFSECADILSLNYSDQNNEISKDFVIYTDYKNNVEYISITNLDGEDGLELMKKIGNKNLSSIIVDIRNNNGGTYTYLKNYLYPILFSSDTEISTYQYFPLSKGNYRIYFDFVNFFTNAYSLVDFELPFDSNGYRYAYNKQTISLIATLFIIEKFIFLFQIRPILLLIFLHLPQSKTIVLC